MGLGYCAKAQYMIVKAPPLRLGQKFHQGPQAHQAV
jgi:hypothetical protein